MGETAQGGANTNEAPHSLVIEIEGESRQRGQKGRYTKGRTGDLRRMLKARAAKIPISLPNTNVASPLNAGAGQADALEASEEGAEHK